VDALHASYDMKRINHSVAYNLDGACTNQAESFLLVPFRRRQVASHHLSAISRRLCDEMGWPRIRGASPTHPLYPRRSSGMKHPSFRQWAGLLRRGRIVTENEHVLGGLFAQAAVGPARSITYLGRATKLIELDHLDATIRIFKPDIDSRPGPKTVPPRHQALPGEMIGALTVLRESKTPLSSAATLFASWRRVMNTADRDWSARLKARGSLRSASRQQR